MLYIVEIVDKTGRKIRLSKERWTHITSLSSPHAYMTNHLEEMQETINKPIKIIFQEKGNLYRYYNYIKHRKHPEKYLRIIVKYLNNHGFILTAHFVKNLQ